MEPTSVKPKWSTYSTREAPKNQFDTFFSKTFNPFDPNSTFFTSHKLQHPTTPILLSSSTAAATVEFPNISFIPYLTITTTYPTLGSTWDGALFIAHFPRSNTSGSSKFVPLLDLVGFGSCRLKSLKPLSPNPLNSRSAVG